MTIPSYDISIPIDATEQKPNDRFTDRDVRRPAELGATSSVGQLPITAGSVDEAPAYWGFAGAWLLERKGEEEGSWITRFQSALRRFALLPANWDNFGAVAPA